MERKTSRALCDPLTVPTRASMRPDPSSSGLLLRRQSQHKNARYRLQRNISLWNGTRDRYKWLSRNMSFCWKSYSSDIILRMYRQRRPGFFNSKGWCRACKMQRLGLGQHVARNAGPEGIGLSEGENSARVWEGGEKSLSSVMLHHVVCVI